MKENNEIPKVIHYCWFGGKPLPKLARKCIKSWRKCLPDFEIKEWNESNFDVNMIPYTEQAYRAGKYAFVSDYARFWILYKYGGVYFDTDVEVIRPMDHILSAGAFMGCETTVEEAQTRGGMLSVAPGLGLAACAGSEFLKEILDKYHRIQFQNPDGSLNLKTIVEYTTELLVEKGLELTPEVQKIGEMTIYPVDYFCPIHGDAKFLDITPNTVSIHHWAASWVSGWPKFREKIKALIGPKLTSAIIRMRRLGRK